MTREELSKLSNDLAKYINHLHMTGRKYQVEVANNLKYQINSELGEMAHEQRVTEIYKSKP